MLPAMVCLRSVNGTILAAVYNASTALKIDGTGYIDCGNAIGLDAINAFAIESWEHMSVQLE